MIVGKFPLIVGKDPPGVSSPGGSSPGGYPPGEHRDFSPENGSPGNSLFFCFFVVVRPFLVRETSVPVIYAQQHLLWPPPILIFRRSGEIIRRSLFSDDHNRRDFFSRYGS